MGQRLRPALLGVAHGEGGGVVRKGQVGVFQARIGRHRIVGLVQDLQIGAHGRQLVRVALQHAHAHAAAHHQQVEQVVVGGKGVDDRKGAIVVRHGVHLRHRRAAHPQCASGQELPHVIDVIEQLFRLLARGGRERAVVFDRAAHGLPPELAAAQPGQEARIGARIDKGAQLAHGVWRVFIGAQEFAGEQAFLFLAAAALLLLFDAVADIGPGRVIQLLLEQGLLDRVLDTFDVDRVLAARGQFGRDGFRDALDRVLIVLARGGGRQRDSALDKAGVEGHDRAAALFYIHRKPPIIYRV